jgi:hypothetical protein
MEKAYNIKEIRFENDYLIVEVDDFLIKLNVADISDKLAKATDKERLDYKISPSGYGIHWTQLDEDLSINGLLSMTRPNTPYNTRYSQ